MDRTTSPRKTPLPTSPLSVPALSSDGWLVDRLDLMLEWLTAMDDLHALAVRLEVAERQPQH